MDNKPIVSIVTPSYNQGKFLEETILSVISQDYPFIEYIIIDGGSSDNSVNTIKKYQDKIKYWVSETDNGQANAINKGWKICHGKIISFLNSDDTYQPGAIAKVVEAFENHIDWGMLYGDGALVDVDGKLIKYQKSKPFNLEKELYCYSIIQPTLFMRRSLLESVGWLDEKLLLSIDFDYVMRAAVARINMGVLVDVYLANSRMHPATKTSTQTINFIYDNELILNRTLDAAKFLFNTKKIRKRALAFLNIRKTEILIDSKEIRKARKSFLRAIQIDTFILMKAQFRDLISIIFKLILNENELSCVRKMKLWMGSKMNNFRKLE